MTVSECRSRNMAGENGQCAALRCPQDRNGAKDRPADRAAPGKFCRGEAARAFQSLNKSAGLSRGKVARLLRAKARVRRPPG
jgi:hypothetical protein